MLENVTHEDIQKEAETEFVKAFPSTYEKYCRQDWGQDYQVEDIKMVFEDGFLAGLLWWKPILCSELNLPKSELQKLVENVYCQESKNIVPENKDQMEFDWKLAKLHKL